MTGGVDPAIALVLRAALALLMGGAAWHKLRDPGGFRAAVRGFGLVPSPLVGPVATVLVAAEVAVAVGLLLLPVGGALGTAVMLALYAGAMAVALARGAHGIECGCGGVAGRQPLAWSMVARNALVAAVALLIVAPTSVRALGWLDAVTVGGALATTAALWTAAHGLLAGGPPTRALAGAPEGA